ncbi:hypothetical protein NQ314_000643 [Rhamnusium bicolor]|uniref:Pre-PUA domain-containing protein n=1 Tax=Rhamnusium bicolor TaxID=1586634 RepID=A0AAV8ZVK5_9CUCU|nr:hypothetical protein NQ314_000643 [Rhamnusium bicolor]
MPDLNESVSLNLVNPLPSSFTVHKTEARSYNRFDEKESISGVLQLKSSVQKSIRSKLVEAYPYLDNYIDSILPKKDALRIIKCHDHIEIIVNSGGELLFFRHRESQWMPTLRLLHKYPFFLPMQQAIMAEGKEHALAIGKTISLLKICKAKVNKGIGVENCHYLNDGLWQMKPVK